MNEDIIKLGGGMIHVGYSSSDKEGEHEAYTTPNVFDVKFLFWAPWQQGPYTVVGGRNIGLSYIIQFKDDKPVVERTFWQRETEGHSVISEELKNLYVEQLRQFAIDLAVECRERKLFEHVICTKEQLKLANLCGDEDWGDKPRLRREWLDFRITQDLKVFEVESLFCYFMAEDGKEYEVLPCKEYPKSFICSPHTVKSRKQYTKYPSTDYKTIHNWLSCYDFDKPIILNSKVPEFFNDKEKIVNDRANYAFMTYDEFIKELRENGDNFADGINLKEYRQAILDNYERVV